MKYFHKEVPSWVEWVLTPFVFVAVVMVALIVTLVIFILCVLKEIPAFRRWYEFHYNKDSLRYKLWKAIERTERYRK